MTTLDNQTRAYLSQSGVGARYHDRSIDDHPYVADFVDRGAFDPVMNGERGLLLVGLEPAREAAILLARWLAVSGHAVLVSSVLNVSRLLTSDDQEESERVMSCHLLVVTDAQTDKDCPMNNWQRARIVDAVRHRMEQSLPTVLVCSRKDLSAWWDDAFRDFVTRNFEVLEYHG